MKLRKIKAFENRKPSLTPAKLPLTPAKLPTNHFGAGAVGSHEATISDRRREQLSALYRANVGRVNRCIGDILSPLKTALYWQFATQVH